MSKEMALSESNLRSSIKKCDACEVRADAVKPLVFEGNPASPIWFVGSVPDATEDGHGLFQGEAGEKLRSVWLPAMGLVPSQVLFTYVLKCHPKNNSKVAISFVRFCCEQWVRQEFLLMAPQLIFLLGGLTVRTLCGDDIPPIAQIAGIRQSVKLWGKPVSVVPLFHPRYFVHQPDAKKEESFIQLLKQFKPVVQILI